MDKIVSVEEIWNKISIVRNNKKGFITNFYFDLVKHSSWIKNSSLFCYSIGNTIFFVKNNIEFWNVFYCSTNLIELQHDIMLFKEKYDDNILMFDIIGNEEQTIRIKSVFENLKLYNYCSLIRMCKKTSYIEYNESFDNVCYATKKHVPEILGLLNTYFDKKAEQIPYIEELNSYAESNQILIYKTNNRIIGFVIFEKNKSTQYLRYWFVHHDYRNLKIGGTLLKYFFFDGRETRRQIFWVIQSNENAIIRYKHYGFEADNLFDIIYTNKNIKYNKYERRNN